MKSRINSPVELQRSEDGSDIAHGVSWPVPTPLPPIPFYTFPNATSTAEESWATLQRTRRNNVPLETHRALPTFSPSFVEEVEATLVDDNSVGIPANKMADCFEAFAAILESTEADNGLRGPIALRFVGKEDALLSSSYAGPIMRMDLADLFYYHSP